jgi:hypothetical protein
MVRVIMADGHDVGAEGTGKFESIIGFKRVGDERHFLIASFLLDFETRKTVPSDVHRYSKISMAIL